MPRLSPHEWERARAEYEVNGLSFAKIGAMFGATDRAISKRAKAEGWIQGKNAPLVDRKVTAVKELRAVEVESRALPDAHRWTVESVAEARLRADGVIAELDSTLARRAREIAEATDDPETLESLSRTRRNLSGPSPKESTTVNVNQQQAAAVSCSSPRDVLAELVRRAREDDGGE